MNVDYPTLDEPATPEYVLAVLRDLHRLEWQIEFEQDPDVSLSFDTTVAEWRWIDEFFDWTSQARAQNKIWEIDVPNHEWKAVLKPTKKRRLREVCELIATHAKRSQIRPARIFGQTCRSAGAFLTIRSVLHQAGAAGEEIAPSTPLAPFLHKHFSDLIVAVSKLAPGALPNIRVHNRAAALLGLLPLLGLLGAGVGSCFGAPLVTIGGIIFFFVIWLLGFVQVFFWAGTVEIRELSTFRDLAQLVADAPRLS